MRRRQPDITVLDLRIDGLSEKQMRSIGSLLSSAIAQTGRHQVIDTAQPDVLLKQVTFSATLCADGSCRLEIGELRFAEAIVAGAVGELGSRYLLSAKMLATETAETLSVADGVSATMNAKVDGLEASAGKLSGSSTARATAGRRPPCGRDSAGAVPR